FPAEFRNTPMRRRHRTRNRRPPVISEGHTNFLPDDIQKAAESADTEKLAMSLPAVAWAAGEDRGPFPPATGSTRICGWDGSTTRVGGGRARHPFVILWTARTFRDSAPLSTGPAGS